MKHHAASIVKRIALSAFCLALVGGAHHASAVTVPKPATAAYTSYVKVAWARTPNAKRYYVYRGTSASFARSRRIKSTTSRVFYDTSATPGVNYYYWVCPVVGRYWYYHTRRYTRGWRQVTAPYVSASYNAYTTHIRVVWGSAWGAKYYWVRRGTTSRYASSSWLTRTTSRAINDTSARPGVKYYYWVVPVGQNGGAWYNASRYDYGMRKKVAALTVPQPYVYRYSDHVRVYWSSVPGAVKYYVFCCRSSAGPGSWTVGNVWRQTTRTYLDDYDQFDNGQIWYYWVCPVNSSGSWWYNAAKYVAGYTVW